MALGPTRFKDQRYLMSPHYETAYDLTVGNTPTFNLTKDKLLIAGVAMTATAAELNIVDGVTATATELNYLDLAALGTGAASKAVVLDAGDDYIWPSAGILTYGGSALNASGKELNALQINTKFTLVEDFHGVWVDTEQLPSKDWKVDVGGGTTPIKATTVSNSVNGEVTMKSATTAGDTGATNSILTGANLGWNAAKGGLAMEVRIKLDDVVEAYLFVGFTDAIATTKNDPISFDDGTNDPNSGAADACGIVFTGDSTTQQFHVGGVKNTADTAANFTGTLPANGVYVTLRVEISAAEVLTAYIDGVVATTVASAITAATAVTPCVMVGNTASAQTIATLDYIWVQQNR